MWICQARYCARPRIKGGECGAGVGAGGPVGATFSTCVSTLLLGCLAPSFFGRGGIRYTCGHGGKFRITAQTNAENVSRHPGGGMKILTRVRVRRRWLKCAPAPGGETDLQHKAGGDWRAPRFFCGRAVKEAHQAAGSDDNTQQTEVEVLREKASWHKALFYSCRVPVKINHASLVFVVRAKREPFHRPQQSLFTDHSGVVCSLDFMPACVPLTR